MRYSMYAVLAVLILFMLGLTQCKKMPTISDPSTAIDIPSSFLTFLPPSLQRAGDPVEGMNYLLTGDYVDSCIPLDVFLSVYGDPAYDLDREGINEGVDHSFNAFVSSNGVELAAPNCFQCHSSTLDGNLILGLGNVNADFTTDQTGTNTLLNQLIVSAYGASSPEYDAFQPFSQAINATSAYLKTETVGSNPADKLAALLAAHRNPPTLGL